MLTIPTHLLRFEPEILRLCAMYDPQSVIDSFAAAHAEAVAGEREHAIAATATAARTGLPVLSVYDRSIAVDDSMASVMAAMRRPMQPHWRASAPAPTAGADFGDAVAAAWDARKNPILRPMAAAAPTPRPVSTSAADFGDAVVASLEAQRSAAGFTRPSRSPVAPAPSVAAGDFGDRVAAAFDRLSGFGAPPVHDDGSIPIPGGQS